MISRPTPGTPPVSWRSATASGGRCWPRPRLSKVRNDLDPTSSMEAHHASIDPPDRSPCSRQRCFHFTGLPCAAINSDYAERARKAHQDLRHAGVIEEARRRRSRELHVRMHEPIVQSTGEQSPPQRRCPKELRFQMPQGAIATASAREVSRQVGRAGLRLRRCECGCASGDNQSQWICLAKAYAAHRAATKAAIAA
jgi:hypothetical protein